MSVLCAATHSPGQPPLPLRTPRRACPRRIGERACVCARARSESTFQGGPTVEVLSASGSNPTSNWKLSGAVQRVYDKTVRGYIVRCDGRQNVRLDDGEQVIAVKPRHLVGLREREYLVRALLSFAAFVGSHGRSCCQTEAPAAEHSNSLHPDNHDGRLGWCR